MDLKDRVVRLAVSHPDLRGGLLPVLRKAASPLPRSWVRAVSKSLSVWDQMQPLADDMTVADAMRMGAAQWAWDLMGGDSGTYNKAKWLYITDDPKGLMKFLERSLTRAFDQHQD